MSRPATITLELRKWHRVSPDCVIGIVYNDRNENYEDGEEGTFNIISWNESINFILVHCSYGILKLEKIEEHGKRLEIKR